MNAQNESGSKGWFSFMLSVIRVGRVSLSLRSIVLVSFWGGVGVFLALRSSERFGVIAVLWVPIGFLLSSYVTWLILRFYWIITKKNGK